MTTERTHSRGRTAGRLAVALVAGLLLLPGAARAAPAKKPVKTVGMVAPRMDGLSLPAQEKVLGQLRATLAQLVGDAKLDVKLEKGAVLTDEAALRKTAVFQDLDKLVTGSIALDGKQGVVRLWAVDKLGGPTARSEQQFPAGEQALLEAAVESGVCHVLEELNGASGCQGTIDLEGDGKIEFFLDGKPVPGAFSVGEVPAGVGEHRAAAKLGDSASAIRPVLVRFDQTVSLRAVERCGGVSLLSARETVGPCGSTDPVVIVLPSDAPPVKWPAIGATAAGVALLVVGAAMNIQARSTMADLSARYDGSGLAPEDRTTYAGARSKATTSGILLGVGAAVGITGGVLFAF
jgi:hypothetical protein